MHANMSSFIPKSRSVIRIILFTFLWICSVLIGMLLASVMQDLTFSLMCAAPLCRVSIVGLVMMRLFPFILLVVSFRFSSIGIICPYLLIKGISVGYCLAGTVISFEYAGWLIGFLLTCSDSVITVLMLWLFLLFFVEEHRFIKRYSCLCAAVVIFISLMDYWFISPYLAALIDFV